VWGGESQSTRQSDRKIEPLGGKICVEDLDRPLDKISEDCGKCTVFENPGRSADTQEEVFSREVLRGPNWEGNKSSGVSKGSKTDYRDARKCMKT